MKNKATKSDTPLANWLRLATATQRDRLSVLAGTSTNYLYQVSSCRREPKVGLAFALEDAMRTLHEESMGILPVVTARDLATMYATEGL